MYYTLADHYLLLFIECDFRFLLKWPRLITFETHLLTRTLAHSLIHARTHAVTHAPTYSLIYKRKMTSVGTALYPCFEKTYSNLRQDIVPQALTLIYVFSEVAHNTIVRTSAITSHTQTFIRVLT